MRYLVLDESKYQGRIQDFGVTYPHTFYNVLKKPLLKLLEVKMDVTGEGNNYVDRVPAIHLHQPEEGGWETKLCKGSWSSKDLAEHFHLPVNKILSEWRQVRNTLRVSGFAADQAIEWGINFQRLSTSGENCNTSSNCPEMRMPIDGPWVENQGAVMYNRGTLKRGGNVQP
ncbi:hypothetical protein MAR_005784 [Mya arenaria]|uniref:Uncharacterized protein n=1 Tax=Mya arenaria TaxID=6604 RepID=A0ABY7F4E9_MYAAR|nr:hypothetical protein MAR_005784 [Mya arenaria]